MKSTFATYRKSASCTSRDCYGLIKTVYQQLYDFYCIIAA